MIGTAIIFDTISIILALLVIGTVPFVNFLLITLPAWTTFLLWFWTCDVIFIRPNKKKFYNVWALLETVPWLVDLLPWWTISVWRAVKLSRQADAERVAIIQPPTKAPSSVASRKPTTPVRPRLNDLRTAV